MPANLDHIDRCIAIIDRFREAASLYRDALGWDPDSERGNHPDVYVDTWRFANAERAAVKRASMDLTRALADLRRSC